MLLKITSVVLFLSFVFLGNSQINIQWEARLDGAGSFIDKAVDLALDASGNTYVTGTSYSGTSFDLVTVKYDANGVEVWRGINGGSGIDNAHAIVLDGAGDVIVTGSKFISGTDWDIITVKYDGTTGVQIWEVIELGSNQFDFGVDVTVDASDNVIVVGALNQGASNVDFITHKYDSAGNLLWTNVFGGPGSDNAKLVKTDAAGNVYVGGHYEYLVGTTFFDFQLVKYSPAGTQLWSVSEDSGFGKLDTPFALEVDGLGNIILAGSGFTDILNEEDYLTVKFASATGAVMWKKLYAGDAEGLDVVNAVAIDAANNVYVTGRSKSLASSEDYYTIAYSAAGVEMWADRYSTTGLGYDEAHDIKISNVDASLYVTGYSFNSATNNDFTTIKYNSVDGTEIWRTAFDGPASNSDQAIGMALDMTDNIFITGNSHGGPTNLDYSTIKYCQLTTEASTDTALCLGADVELSATGGDDITWSVLSGDLGSMSCTVCETMIATPSETSVYTVSSTSLSGCVDYDTVVVTINPIPVVEIYNDTPLDFCNGSSVVLYTDSYEEYNWSTTDLTPTIEVSSSMTVTLSVTDINGCLNSASTEVVVYALPVVEAGDNSSICPGTGIELLATGATNYAWDPEASLSALLVADPLASPLGDIEYKVTGTDDNGCVGRDSLTITLFDLPNVDAGGDETICIQDSVQLEVIGATTYVWDAVSSLSDLDIANPWAKPTGLTEYFVTGTDDNGCVNRDSINVSTLALPDISAGTDALVCAGVTVDLFVTGGLFDMYEWNPEPTLSALNVFDPHATTMVSVEYIVKGTDVNGCSNSDSVFVHVHDLPSVSAGDDESICIGDSVQLGASGALDYSWNSDPSLSSIVIVDPWAQPVSTKTYTVTGVDANGCENQDDVIVVVNNAPAISAGSDIVLCEGDSTQLGASGGVIYVWEFHESLSNFVVGDPWASPVETIVYTVEGTDEFGCSNTDEVIVLVQPMAELPVLYVSDGVIVSSIEDGNQWFHEGTEITGATNDSLDYVAFGENGEYWVLYTNDLGCSILSDRILNPIFITDVGIKEEDSFEVLLYPNPTSSLLNVKYEGELDEVTIQTMDGKLMERRINLVSGIDQFDLSDLPRGTYLIQLIQDDHVLIKKLIKQ